MQHLDALAQAAAKQRMLEDALWHIGKIEAEIIHALIDGPAWGYRHRARLSVRVVPSKGGVLIGFHQKRSSHIADMQSCVVLPAQISALVPALHVLIAGLSIADRVPQIEIAVSDTATAFVFRHLLPFSAHDLNALTVFADTHGVQVWLQPAGPESAARLHPQEGPGLAYTLPEFDVRMDFRPTDFTQVNVHINRLLVRRAMQLLDPRPGERIADLFCGVGTFTFRLAGVAPVLAADGAAPAVRALSAAISTAPGLHGVTAEARDLTRRPLLAEEMRRIDTVVFDPPRAGAAEQAAEIARSGVSRAIGVSCNPATFVRDARTLIDAGFRLERLKPVDQFLWSPHIELVGVFSR